ncbi:SAM-dependent methyltransferase [Streptomyces sp. DSM 44915]|uniref:SAM-dependent methyltransferase n=1 Tax=Streptomyces chisholmiae TaxID=3075540 RepID=A0ABU2JU44_9ACTN|nr:SAM-dependent methyltransferase [Streptomyces sp. DSM 44915]MDT0268512.1 SAM-dependent methyltransferase [Streptomyces sp. DSM 44915]
MPAEGRTGGREITSHIDISTPSIARMYEYLLGGAEHYQVDREACAELLRVAPSAVSVMRNSRAFLERAVRCLAAEHGVTQYIDFGVGLPARENVHQIAREYVSEPRVVYVDIDPMAVAHGRLVLEEDQGTLVLGADITRPNDVFDDPRVVPLLQARPTAALFGSVLHCLSDEQRPAEVVAQVRERLAPGSFVVISHLVSDDEHDRREISALMAELTGGRWGRVRQRAEVEAYFAGTRLLEPGVTDAREWRPDGRLQPPQGTDEWTGWCGVARI